LNARVARWKKKSFCGLVCAQAQPTNKQPRVLSSRQRARRGAAKTSASEFCFSGFSGSRKSRKRKTSLTSLRAVSKRRRTETRIVSPLFPTDQYKHVSLCGPTNAASRDRTRAQLPDETARGLFSRGKARANARRTVYFPATGRKKRTGNEGRASEEIFFGFRLRERPKLMSFAPKSVMERYGTSPHDSDISRRDRPRGASTPRETFGFCFKGTGRANMSVRRPTR
jgi:hypothetical protein